MSTRQIAYVALLAALYVVIGQFTRYLPNPMLRGQGTIALNMVVIVVAGILMGPVAGALTGLIGTLINALVTAGTGSGQFELAAVIPHTIMGAAAGLVRAWPVVLAALSIIVGHVLNIAAFIFIGLLPASTFAASAVLLGLLLEIVIDVAVISVVVPLLRPLLKPS